VLIGEWSTGSKTPPYIWRTPRTSPWCPSHFSCVHSRVGLCPGVSTIAVSLLARRPLVLQIIAPVHTLQSSLGTDPKEFRRGWLRVSVAMLRSENNAVTLPTPHRAGRTPAMGEHSGITLGKNACGTLDQECLYS
jgi:hypothetical protein